MSLQEFLNNNPVDGLTAEVVISDRFKDEKGNLLKFKIRAMSSDEFEDCRKRSMTISGGKRRNVDLDLRKFNNAIVINNTIDPSFKDAESIKQLGCTTPEQYLSKVLLPGEIQELSSQIQQLSGFREMDELVEEAKN